MPRADNSVWTRGSCKIIFMSNILMPDPKYSIIVPVFNGMPYLKACIESIVSQVYTDYELIISDDNSTDGSREYLQSINHPNVKVLLPEKGKSMAEHWEWALSFASGEWQIFVGQDDGLQKYFFDLADRLTQKAKNKGLRAIVTSRAYYFWPGCESTYNDRVRYSASDSVCVKTTFRARLKALFTDAYHNFPQMYCNSIFRKSLLDEARDKQGGFVFVSHPQDANLAALCCKLEKKYLWCGIPLGWVGTSPKSAGHAVSQGVKKINETEDKRVDGLRDEYVKRVSNSDIKYHRLAGDFGFADTNVYFWQCLLKTSRLNKSYFDVVVGSYWFRYLFLSAVLARMSHAAYSEKKKEMLEDLIERNGFSYASLLIGGLVFKVFYWLRASHQFAMVRVSRKFMRVLQLSGGYNYRLSTSDNPNVSMNEVGDLIAQLVKDKRWV